MTPADPAAAPPPDDQAALDALFADAPDARDPAAWVDEPPPPAWALRRAALYYGYLPDEPVGMHLEEQVDDLARLLASVREGALREAAGLFPVGHAPGGIIIKSSIAKDILSLLHTPPSGGGV